MTNPSARRTAEDRLLEVATQMRREAALWPKTERAQQTARLQDAAPPAPTAECGNWTPLKDGLRAPTIADHYGHGWKAGREADPLKGIRDAKYLNPVCSENGCQWLHRVGGPLGEEEGCREAQDNTPSKVPYPAAPPERVSEGKEPLEGAGLIAQERQRQQMVEGWTDSHDDEHDNGEMVSAAIAYLTRVMQRRPPSTPPPVWPWEPKWWKFSDDTIRNLVKAGALIAAEIDRLERAARPAVEPREESK